MGCSEDMSETDCSIGLKEAWQATVMLEQLANKKPVKVGPLTSEHWRGPIR